MPDRISVRNFFQGFSSSLYSCIPLNIGRVGLTHVENSVKTNSQVFLSLFNTLYIYRYKQGYQTPLKGSVREE